MKKLHEQIRAQIEKENAAYKARANKHRKYKEFNPEDLPHLRNNFLRIPRLLNYSATLTNSMAKKTALG